MSIGTFALTGIDIPGFVSPKVQTTEGGPRLERLHVPALAKTTTSKSSKTIAFPSRKLNQTAKTEFPKLDKNKGEEDKKRITSTTFHSPLLKKISEIYKMKETKSKPEKTFFEIKKKDDDKPKDKHAATFSGAFDDFIKNEFNKTFESKSAADKLHQRATTEFNATKKKHLAEQLEREYEKLQGTMKKYNDLAHESKSLEATISILQTKETDLDLQLQDNSKIVEIIERLKNQRDDLKVKTNWEEYQNEILTSMRLHKKEHLVRSKTKATVIQQELKSLMTDIHSLQNKKTILKEYLERRKHQEQDTIQKRENSNDHIDPDFETLLENEVEEYEEKRKLKHLMNYEKEAVRAKEEYERMKYNEREERVRRRQEEEFEIKRRESEKARSALESKREIFLGFKRVTEVNSVKDLPRRWDELNEQIDKQQNEADEHERKKEDLFDELRRLNEELKLISVIKEVPPISDKFKNDAKIDEIEELVQEGRNKKSHIEGEISRLMKVLNEACTVVSRIYYQVQKGKIEEKVQHETLVTVLSICSLKLERMLTLVIKKRRVLFMESINTEGSEDYPPPYMGIIYKDLSNKIKEDPEFNELKISKPGDEEDEEDDIIRLINKAIKERKGAEEIEALTKEKKDEKGQFYI